MIMLTRNGGTLIALTTLAILGFGNSVVCAGLIYQYDPGLGTLPEAQGFTRFDNFGTEPEPTVSGGLLHQFSSGAGPSGGAQYWFRDSAPLNFATTPYAFEADLLVLSSNYDLVSTFPNQRSGYYLQATDSIGRSFAVGIASAGITINTDVGFGPTNGVPFMPFDTTDSFHTYRLLIDSGVGSFFIDGNLFASTPLGGAVHPGIANRVVFGDATGAGASETDLRHFRFETPDNAVPEPASLVLWSLGALGFVGSTWRRQRMFVRPV